jgi:hypothetical protein
MFTLVVLSCLHAVAASLPLLAALWGMVAVACCYEWRRYLLLARGARLAPEAWHWLVIEPGHVEYIQSIRCQELVIRRYSH